MMAVFRFRLEAVLTHRLFLEDEARRELADALREWEARKDAVARIASLKRERADELDIRSRKGLPVWERLLYLEFGQRLDRDIDEARKAVDAAAKVLDDKREALLEARKARKMLEKLREKDERLHREKLSREEARFMNDIAACRYVRHRGRSA